MGLEQPTNLENLSITLGGKELFEDVSFRVDKNTRAGLVGYNGSGKSTLLKIMAGEVEPDQGRVILPKGIRVGYMQQFTPEHMMTMDVFNALSSVARLPHEDYEIEAILYQLGFQWEEIYEKPVQTFSGGWQKLIMFASTLVDEPDLLLMDEPTNHMDVRARALFEEFVSGSLRAPFIVVSHDRDFLDRFTNQTMFLRDRRLYQFGSPYSASRESLIHQDIAAMEARQAEEKELRRLRSSAKRLALWGDRNNENAAKASKNMRKRIDRLEDDQTFVSNDESGNLKISTEQMKADQVVRMEQVTVKAPDSVDLFEVNELTIRPGDRVALLGANGVGKSTLLRAIDNNHRRFSQNADWDYGFRFNPSATIGFFDQDLSALDPNITVEGAMVEHVRGANRQTIVNKLIKAGFPYDQQSIKVSDLSGGERARLQLLILQETQHSLLLLDEPTSHLDIMGVEDLEAQLVEGEATCLFTSHDRRFIENVANRLLLVRNGRIIEIHDLNEFYTGLEP